MSTALVLIDIQNDYFPGGKKEITQLVIAGMMTHMCVGATARAATDFGFDCLIAQDACATKVLRFGDRPVPAPQVHAAFLAALDGSYGHVLAAEEIIRRLRS